MRNPRQHGLAGQRPLARLDEHLRAGRQVGVQPGAEPDQAVGVADGDGIADVQIADDAPGDQPGDLNDHHLLSIRRADQHAVALVVVAGGRQIGGMEASGPVLDRQHLTADGGALDMSVQQGQEDADPRHRVGGQAEFGRRRRHIDQAYLPVGGGDDGPGPGRGGAVRVPEEAGIGGGGGKTGPSHPAVVAPEYGHRDTGRDERPPGGVDGRYRRSHQFGQPLRAGLRGHVGASGHRADSSHPQSGEVPYLHRLPGGDIGDVLADVEQAVGRGQPAQVMGCRWAVAGDGARRRVVHPAAELPFPGG